MADLPFICLHQDPRCEDDPCPRGIAQFLCNAPADHPLRQNLAAPILPANNPEQEKVPA